MGGARLKTAVLGFAVFLPSLGGVDRAMAQVSASLTAESAYRFRGVDLTNSKADVRLALGYDHPSGAYAGGSLMVGSGSRGDIHVIGYQAYAGYVRPLRPGLNLDLGATYARVVDVYPRRLTFRTPDNSVYGRAVSFRYEASYAEGYVGLVADKIAVHLYLSPEYYGEPLTTAYLDLGGAVRPAQKVRLFWHAGVLAPLDRRGALPRQNLYYDLRAGAALELPQGELQIAWTTIGPTAEYPIAFPLRQKKNAVIVSASAFF